MKSNLLLPNKYKTIGWIMILAFGIIGWQTMNHDFGPLFTRTIEDHGWHIEIKVMNTICLIGFILGLIIVCFSQEKQEDEYISLLRLKSWQSAVLFSYLILIIASAIVYGISFLQVMMYNMFTIPLAFIIKFNYSLYKLRTERTE